MDGSSEQWESQNSGFEVTNKDIVRLLGTITLLG